MRIFIEDLGLTYGDKIIFDGANMFLNKPGIYPLIGLNGAGKTSLCRLLMGLLPPDEGRVVVNEKNPALLIPLDRSKFFSYLPQQEEIFSSVNVRELLRMNFFYRDSFYWRIEFNDREKNLLENFGILSYLDSPFEQLSGGERRKILLTSMFLRDSPIIILDEPFIFLDPKRKKEMIKLIEEEKERFIIVVSHDRDFVKKHLGNTFCLKNKAIEAAQGTYDDVFNEVYR